ncbi:hypothetical protein ABZP36_019633 [Zizania latifolia]
MIALCRLPSELGPEYEKHSILANQAISYDQPLPANYPVVASLPHCMRSPALPDKGLMTPHCTDSLALHCTNSLVAFFVSGNSTFKCLNGTRRLRIRIFPCRRRTSSGGGGTTLAPTAPLHGVLAGAIQATHLLCLRPPHHRLPAPSALRKPFHLLCLPKPSSLKSLRLPHQSSCPPSSSPMPLPPIFSDAVVAFGFAPRMEKIGGSGVGEEDGGQGLRLREVERSEGGGLGEKWNGFAALTACAAADWKD